MSAEQFLQCYDLLPDAMLLVSGDGAVLAASRGVADRLDLPVSEVVGRALADVATERPADIAQYLRACSRSRAMVPGLLTLRRPGGQLACRAEGTVFRPRTPEQPAQTLLRLRPKKDAPNQFLALTRRVNELSREVAQQARAEEELTRQREWLQVTLSSIGDAVIATDARGHVNFMNPVAEALTGWKQAEAEGKPLEEVFHIVSEETRRAVESPVAKVLRDGAAAGLANHTVLIARGGSERPIDDCGAPIRDGRGKLVGVVLVFHDVTLRRDLERELSRRAAQLAEEVRRKDHFLAVLAHELRNPLAPIRNALHVLDQPGASAPVAEQARRIMHRQLQQMTALIDDLLDLAVITQGRLPVRLEPADFSELVGKFLEASRPLIEERRHTLEFRPSPGLVVAADPVRVGQIVSNLISNAAKFTDRGGQIVVTVRREGDQAVLRVRDTGQGIPGEMLGQIFVPFSHVDRPLAATTQWGLGVGLSIVRSLAELHGGTVEATSPGPGQGSEFIVRLPLVG